MEKEDVIKIFLRHGYQLSNSALPLVMSSPEKIIKDLNKFEPRPFIITEHHIKKILEEKTKQIYDVKLLKEFRPSLNKFTVDDVVAHFLSTYDKTKKIIFEHMPTEKLISINKITPKTQYFSIIAIVKEIFDDQIVVEDSTGEISLFFDEETKQKLNCLEIDDIVGIFCKKNENKIYITDIIYPDLPVAREVNKTSEELMVVFLSNPKENVINQKLFETLSPFGKQFFVFMFCDKKITTNLPNNITLTFILKNSPPKLFQLDKIKILTISDPWFEKIEKETSDPILFSLKRRNITPKINCIKNDSFVLEDVPDIILSSSCKGEYKNYKGTTIISNPDSQKIYLINLKTRDVEEKIL
jgi:DNA polymerase II small subunit/DNA polymerase delta subunit B